MMGWRLDFASSKKILSLAHSNDISFIDTSVSYARGDCHKMISRVLNSLKLRNKFFISTKVGGISDKNGRHFGFSKDNILRQCNLSLRQLNVETIDLLQLHNPACSYLSEEILDSLNELKIQGKIQNYGVCNFQQKHLIEFIACAKKLDMAMPISNQFEYNLLNYHEQTSLIKFLHSKEIQTITWGLLASGLLTEWYLKHSKIKPKSRIESGRELHSKNELLQEETTQETLKKILRVSKELGISAQIFCALWARQTQPKNCLLLGPSSFEQFNEIIQGINKFKGNKIDLSDFKNK